MTLTQQTITILMVVIGTMMTRFLPFLLFPAGKPTPKYIQYLGKVLPSAVFGLLVVYCLKDVSVLDGSHGVPELIAIAIVVGLHYLEEADAFVDCGRNHMLYAVDTACLLDLCEQGGKRYEDRQRRESGPFAGTVESGFRGVQGP